MSTDALLDFSFGKTARQRKDDCHRRMRCSAHVRRQLLESREFTVLEMIDKSPTGSAAILSSFFEKETDEVVRGQSFWYGQLITLKDGEEVYRDPGI